MSAGKIDWLMGLESKSKCDVSARKLNSGTSGNSLIILSTEFPHRCQFHFPAQILDTDLFHFHSSLNHFQQISKKENNSRRFYG